ncbi:uncharacterized protein TNCV_747191 [Trichonephila clavipes]|nr:uncharacterized protein TNCV_747191 [Trichonephila clavipes]
MLKTRWPGLKYPKVTAYCYGATHQNVINCSSVDNKPIRAVRTCAHYSAIADDKLVTLTLLVELWTQQQKVQCVLWLTEFKSLTCVQRRFRTEYNVVTGLPNRLIRTPTK